MDLLSYLIGKKSCKGDGNVDNQYDKGFADGKAEGIEEGKQAEYDRFWDVYQQNGERVSYGSAFQGQGWTADTFKPKYPVRPISSENIFYNSTFAGDMRDYCELDLKKMREGRNLFYGSAIQHLGVIDLQSTSGGGGAYATASNMFNNAKNLETIEKIIFYKDCKYSIAGMFNLCPKLREVQFEGELLPFQGTKSGNLDMSSCTLLSKNSIISCINVLSLESSGKTATFSQAAVDKAFETSEGANDGSTSDEWLALEATKEPAWTIALV